MSCHVSHDRRPMDAERVRERVDGLTVVAPMDELGDVVVGQPSLVLHHRVCPASGDRASEHDRQKSRHCEERVAGVRKPSLKVHTPATSVRLAALGSPHRVVMLDGERGPTPVGVRVTSVRGSNVVHSGPPHEHTFSLLKQLKSRQK